VLKRWNIRKFLCVEAILNAVIHRYYGGNSFFYIKVFDERMELWNEGQLIKPFSDFSQKEL